MSITGAAWRYSRWLRSRVTARSAELDARQAERGAAAVRLFDQAGVGGIGDGSRFGGAGLGN
jgi:hypothetical protein